MAFFFSVKEEFVSNETVFAVASVGKKDTQNQCVGAKKPQPLIWNYMNLTRNISMYDNQTSR